MLDTKRERRKKITLKNEDEERNQDGGKAGQGVHFFPQVYKNTSSEGGTKMAVE